MFHIILLMFISFEQNTPPQQMKTETIDSRGFFHLAGGM